MSAFDCIPIPAQPMLSISVIEVDDTRAVQTAVPAIYIADLWHSNSLHSSIGVGTEIACEAPGSRCVQQ